MMALFPSLMFLTKAGCNRSSLFLSASVKSGAVARPPAPPAVQLSFSDVVNHFRRLVLHLPVLATQRATL